MAALTKLIRFRFLVLYMLGAQLPSELGSYQLGAELENGETGQINGQI